MYWTMKLTLSLAVQSPRRPGFLDTSPALVLITVIIDVHAAGFKGQLVVNFLFHIMKHLHYFIYNSCVNLLK